MKSVPVPVRDKVDSSAAEAMIVNSLAKLDAVALGVSWGFCSALGYFWRQFFWFSKVAM